MKTALVVALFVAGALFAEWLIGPGNPRPAPKLCSCHEEAYPADVCDSACPGWRQDQ